MRTVRVGPLPDRAMDAAAAFHSKPVPLEGDVVLVFTPASYEHRGWRVAAVQNLARAAAPARVNGVVGDDEQAIAATLAWLDQAPGVTGQLLSVEPG